MTATRTQDFTLGIGKEASVQKVPDTPENMSRCICGGCPSYPGAGRLLLRQGEERSAGPAARLPLRDCAIFKEYGLQDGYYCIGGVAGETAQ